MRCDGPGSLRISFVSDAQGLVLPFSDPAEPRLQNNPIVAEAKLFRKQCRALAPKPTCSQHPTPSPATRPASHHVQRQVWSLRIMLEWELFMKLPLLHRMPVVV